MEARLQVPYRDTAAGDLVWRLGEAPRPALAALELAVPGGQLELRLLGHSHQVIFTPGEAVISEVVACGWDAMAGRPQRNRLHFGAGSGGEAQPVALSHEATGLPAAAERVLDGWGYAFRSRNRRLRADRFGQWIDLLATRMAGRPDAIVGRFPGSPRAVTALLAGPGPGGAGVRWRTWHAYPQEQRLVSTATTVRRR